jgi:hypothetical protein
MGGLVVPRCTFALALLSATFAVGAAGANAAPRELYGKSIVVTWTEERVQRLNGQGPFQSVSINGAFSAYVSTMGNIFSRNTMSNPAARRGRGAEGSREREGSTGHMRVSFAGRTLVAIGTLAAHGALRVAVTFDQGFTSCNANVIRGKETGAASIIGHSMIRPGVEVEIQSVRTTGVSCSLRDGNVFAGG